MSLKLVSNEDDYGYDFYIKIVNPQNEGEWNNANWTLLKTLKEARIDDYKLAKDRDTVAVTFKSILDHLRFTVALMAGDQIQHDLIITNPEFDICELERHWYKMKDFLDSDPEFGKAIALGMSEEQRKIVLLAFDRATYFDFCDKATRSGLSDEWKKIQNPTANYAIHVCELAP